MRNCTYQPFKWIFLSNLPKSFCTPQQIACKAGTIGHNFVTHDQPGELLILE